ncbi:MAG: hypothetical protein AAF570_20630, partial [Bacteroidota bacterium]
MKTRSSLWLICCFCLLYVALPAQLRQAAATTAFFDNPPTPSSDSDYGAGKAAGKISLLVPGLGNYRVTGDKKALLYAPVCYGLVAGGIYAQLRAQRDYGAYK